jgi:hypothetical protein
MAGMEKNYQKNRQGIRRQKNQTKEIEKNSTQVL